MKNVARVLECRVVDVGIIGLGRMGGVMARKLAGAGHDVIGWDLRPEIRAAAVGTLRVADDLATLVKARAAPRVVWLMVPHDAVDDALKELLPRLDAGDVVVDGGNSHFKDTQRRAGETSAKGISLVDVGVSGGPRGADIGFSLMVGGDRAAVSRVDSILQDLAAPYGAYGYVGSSGAGHFAKMVHNGVEYGMMEAIAEGVDVLAHGPFQDIDLAEVARVWRSGSVVRSYLVDLLAEILATERLASVRGVARATGEGEWTVDTAREHNIDVPAIAAAVERRKASQKGELFAAKILALLRNRFGGHGVDRTS